MTQETPCRYACCREDFFVSIQRHAQCSWSSTISGLYILLSPRWGSPLKGHRKRDGMVRLQPFFFWLNLPCAEVQYILLTGCKWFLNASVCAHKTPLAFSVWAQSGIVRSECGQPEEGRGLRRLGHGCMFSPLEQWLELTAVPVTYSTALTHSCDALCRSPCGGLLGEKKKKSLQAF